MKVLLIFPPLWIPYRPYLALPSLYAYLKDKGIEVVQKDFNVEAYHLLLSEDYIKGLKGKLGERFEGMDAKDKLMPGIEQEYYYDLYKAKSSIDYVAGKIEHAKEVFRNRRAFYDINALSNARGILKQAQVIISTACFPSGQDLLRPVNVRFRRSFTQIEHITNNREDNPFVELYEKHLMPDISKEDPDVVGISITVDGQLIPALTLSRMIKSAYKKVHVVVGGHIITALTDTLARYPQMFNFFDSAVVNEGEKPLLSLVEHLSEGQPLGDVPNLIYLEDGGVCANEILPAEDINLLPTPCFDGLPLGRYLSPEPVLPILASRGCYWGKCAFCSDNLCTAWRYQNRNASKVVEDMQELARKYGVTHFAFGDEAIAPALMSKLCDEIIERGMDVRCSTYIRLERQFTPELCRKMYRAGFRLLFLGLESACNRILGLMNKGIDKETAALVCRNIYEAGIWNHLLVFLGFPTETRAEAQETIDFLLSNRNIIHSFKMNSFVLDKKSPIAKNPGKYGINYIEDGPDTDFDLTYNYTVSSGLTFDEAMQLNIVSQKRIAREYESQKFFQLDGEDIILYLSHYEKSDPYLKSAAGANAAGTQTRPLTENSMPRLRRNVILAKTRFDIVEVIHYLANNENTVIYPHQVISIFDPASGNLLPVDSTFADLLGLCNGQNSIKKIACDLAGKYDAPQSKIEESCLAFLKPLYREGYIIS